MGMLRPRQGITQTTKKEKSVQDQVEREFQLSTSQLGLNKTNEY